MKHLSPKALRTGFGSNSSISDVKLIVFEVNLEFSVSQLGFRQTLLGSIRLKTLYSENDKSVLNTRRSIELVYFFVFRVPRTKKMVENLCLEKDV